MFTQPRPVTQSTLTNPDVDKALCVRVSLLCLHVPCPCLRVPFVRACLAPACTSLVHACTCLVLAHVFTMLVFLVYCQRGYSAADHLQQKMSMIDIPMARVFKGALIH